MRRVLFVWFGRPVHSYPAMLYVGIVLGIYAQLGAARAIGLDLGRILVATLVLLTAALLGARLLHILAQWPLYRAHPRRILRFAEGGASMYGGVLVAVPLSLPLLAWLGLPFGAFWDTASFTMLVGMIVTRAGCFLNGCCAGRPTDGAWGVELSDHRGVRRRRIPLQALEAAWGLGVLAGACGLWSRRPLGGAVLLYTLGAYGAGRILLERLRDEIDRVMGTSLHRAISTGFVVIALGALAIAWLR
jgi:phosphatidylglycerol:prolipoprotein diacylglycerol transferase